MKVLQVLPTGEVEDKIPYHGKEEQCLSNHVAVRLLSIEEIHSGGEKKKRVMNREWQRKKQREGKITESDRV